MALDSVSVSDSEILGGVVRFTGCASCAPRPAATPTSICCFLRAAVFFQVLDNPERIEVLEKMGHLEREDASVTPRNSTAPSITASGSTRATPQASSPQPR